MQTTRFNVDIAKVAVQEAWIKILRSAHRYDPKLASVETWASMITRQCATDLLRSLYSRGELSEEPDALDFIACPLPQADDALYQSQVERAAAQCIEALPSTGGPNYRLALELALENELKYDEMVARLQQQVGGGTILNAERVRGWVKHAVKRMRACLNKKLGWNPERPAP